MATKTVGVRLDAETQERLKRLGERRDRTPHYLMKTAIADYLNREEAEQAELEELQHRWKQYELTGESVPHEQVLKWFDSVRQK